MSWKSRSSKTNVRIILVGDIISQVTFEHIYDFCPIGERGRVIGNYKVESFKLIVIKDMFIK